MYGLNGTNCFDCPVSGLLWFSDSGGSSVVHQLALQGAGSVSQAEVRIPVPGCGGGIGVLCIMKNRPGEAIRTFRNVRIVMHRQGRVVADSDRKKGESYLA